MMMSTLARASSQVFPRWHCPEIRGLRGQRPRRLTLVDDDFVPRHGLLPTHAINGHSARRAWMTLTRAARAAGSQDATTAAVSSTNAERITGKAPGIFTSRK